jgi:hypothetical protein
MFVPVAEFQKTPALPAPDSISKSGFRDVLLKVYFHVLGYHLQVAPFYSDVEKLLFWAR